MNILRMCDFPTSTGLKEKNSIINNGLAITNIIPQSKEYIRRGHKIIIFSGGTNKNFYENVGGISVYRSRIPRAKNLLFGFGLLLSWKNILKREGKIDLIIIHNPLTGAGLWCLKKILGVPIIVYVHGTFTINNLFEGWLAKKTLQSANVIISISPPTTKQIISIDKNLKNKIHLIRNGAQVENFKPTGKIQNKIIFFGRDTKQKNLETFLKASKILRKKYGNYKFGVIGAEINDERIDFSKIVSLTQVPKEISKSIIVMPYFANTFGKTTPEAMAMECVVVGTNTDIPSDVKDLGFFYDVQKAKDENFLAKQIEKAIKSDRIKIGKKARAKVVKEYSWKRNVEHQMKVVNRLLKKEVKK